MSVGGDTNIEEPLSPVYSVKKRSQFEAYLHVMHALMLRDMRTRFGGSYWGYVVAVMWPVAHVFMLVTIFVTQKAPAPVGDSRAVFFASGAVPVLIFQYIAREVMKGVITNKPLTYYPAVKLIDVVFARILVEISNGFTGLIIIFFVLMAFGVDPRPADPFTAMCGYLASIMLGIGVGVINVSIVFYFPPWIFGFVLFTIIIYITSGVIYMPSFLPPQIYNILKYNPAVQTIEWVRSGYYPSLGLEVDKMYVIMFALTSLMIGLLLERFLIRKFN